MSKRYPIPFKSSCYFPNPSRREVNETQRISATKTETMVANGNLEKKAAGASPDQLTAAFGRQLSLASRAIHADDYTNTHPAVAPPMHVSTTFRYSDNPDKLLPWADMDVSYARIPRNRTGLTARSPPRSMRSTSTRERSRQTRLAMKRS
jgi:hypothetical protein